TRSRALSQVRWATKLRHKMNRSAKVSLLCHPHGCLRTIQRLQLVCCWTIRITHAPPNTVAGKFRRFLSAETMRKSPSGAAPRPSKRRAATAPIFSKGNKRGRLAVFSHLMRQSNEGGMNSDGQKLEQAPAG